MRYPVEKYKIVVHQHPDYHTTEIIAMSTYAGQVVKGKAICHINDTYSEEKGKRLAIARCAAKIAKKRKARAEKLYHAAERQVEAAKRHRDAMKHYALDANTEVQETQVAVENILNERV
jgi:hypothetical protein